jgi:energy-coupling factor transporter ATP-binding protein EcfA2
VLECGRSLNVNRNLSFTYENASSPSLRNLNIKIEPGETVAIVGYVSAMNGLLSLTRDVTGTTDLVRLNLKGSAGN